MKIFSVLLAAFCIAQCLTGCQPTTPEDTQPTTESVIPTTESETVQDTTADDLPFIKPENLYSVSVPITTEYGYAEDESIVFSYAYQAMYLIHPDRDVADKIIIDFLTRIEETRSDAEQLFDSAKAKNSSAAGFAPYFYQVHYDPTRIDQGVLSLHGHITQSADYGHSNVQCVSANYDMVTGDALTLGSILYRADKKSELCEIVISALEDRTDIGLYDDFRSSVEKRFERDESQDEDFYFTSSGLCFYFSPYEIAPYAAGAVTVEIPYHELTGIIGDACFPAEQTNSSGTVSICAFEEANLEDYTQFAEIVVASGATKLLLTTDNLAQNLQIKALTWNDDGSTEPQAYTIFAANVLSSQEAILLEADFSSEKPGYILSYNIDGVACSFYLEKDSKTGQIILNKTV